MIADETVRVVEGWRDGKRLPDDLKKPDAKRFKSGTRGGGKKGGGHAKQQGFKSGGYGNYAGYKKW